MRNKIVKFEEKLIKFEEKIRKVELLPTRDCEAGYGPEWISAVNILTQILLTLLTFIALPILRKLSI